MNWREAIRSKSFVIQSAITLLALLTLALIIGPFFSYVQSVEGTSLNDPLLAVIPADDVSVIIFTLIYGGIVVGIIHVNRFPYIALRSAQAYVLLTMLRMLAMFLVPLEPDQSLVPLRDPLVNNFFYEDQIITKDLFFSGHVSVIAMFAMITTNFHIKRVLFVLAFMIAVSLLIQHVHYTIDVVAAPAFAWISVKIVEKFPTAPQWSKVK